MCLDKLAGFEIEENFGWQMFEFRNGILGPWFCVVPTQKAFNSVAIPLDQWQKDRNRGKLGGFEGLPIYRTGFHIYKENPPTRTPTRKVYFRNVVATGYFNGKRTIVARERYVCDKTDKPPEEP